MTDHYRRGDPETGCAWMVGWGIALSILLWLFILGALVPWIVGLLT